MADVVFAVELLGKVWIFKGTKAITELIEAMDNIASAEESRHWFGQFTDQSHPLTTGPSNAAEEMPPS